MFESDKKSPLERLNKSLYSRTDKPAGEKRHELEKKDPVVSESWQEEHSDEPIDIEQMKSTRKTYNFIFFGALLFFVISTAIGAYTLFGGRNFVSADNVDILIEGPSAINGGEKLSLQVSVVNKNATDIDDVDLIVEYPEGSKDGESASNDLTRVTIPLGAIASQSVSQETLSSVLFGEEGALRQIKFKVEYTTANSNAVFYKEKSYNITIQSSPIIVGISALDKVLGGQTSDFTFVVTSNTTQPVKDVLLVLDYPFGFKVISSNPQTSYGDNVWRIGDLAPGAKKTITIKASAEGQDNEERVIRASVGIQSKQNEREMATTIITRDHAFSIEKPFLAIDLTLDGTRGDIAAIPGRSVRGEIIFTNNSTDRIVNARIEAKLSGNVLNKNSVSVDGGYYDSLSNTIIWEAGRNSNLETLAPGDTRRLGFGIASTNSSPGQSILNPQITVSVSASGDRVDSGGVPQEITAAVTRSVKLLSSMSISGRALRSQGPITNSGPIPPRVDMGTTYTIVWTVTNTSNNITGAKVTASLPPYVTWTGTVSPNDGSIVYNDTGGNITWNVGSIPKDTTAKQIHFQVSLRPSANQIGSSPEIISQARMTGTDSFANVLLETTAPSLSTRTSSDLQFKEGDELVQP